MRLTSGLASGRTINIDSGREAHHNWEPQKHGLATARARGPRFGPGRPRGGGGGHNLTKQDRKR